MAGKKNELGTTGVTVAANVKRLREGQNLTYAELSRRLDATGRPIPVLGLARVEAGTRRVDADDLMALAVVLGVSPSTLLMPDAPDENQRVDATGVVESVPAQRLWNWLRAENPLDSDAGKFMLAANPAWVREELRNFLGEMFPKRTSGEVSADGDD
ncbi:helix-turn-helix domain-containing protein [Nocardia sp. NPDC058705]|uniref:helix-turn-helix domain-containing protein n=1 Tax=Nocardia sp. NPDC058705 TaxID=3346609 RepID=UPI0036A2E1DA